MSNPTVLAIDVTDEADELPDEIKFLSKKVTNLVHQYNKVDSKGEYQRKLAAVKMVGFSCPKDDYKAGIDYVVKTLKHIYYAEDETIVGFLGPIINKVEMANDRCVVVSYPALTEVGENLMYEDIGNGILQEGGMPTNIEDVNDLPKD